MKRVVFRCPSVEDRTSSASQQNSTHERANHRGNTACKKAKTRHRSTQNTQRRVLWRVPVSTVCLNKKHKISFLFYNNNSTCPLAPYVTCFRPVYLPCGALN